ncbi:MAG: AmmeMemoRadiSam system protein B [Anaerolineales bacterium]|nr:AmmeMemoRadiSam system protein B [Anaerolineales bacterium]
MDLRPSPLAGRWYSAQPAALQAAVDGFLAAAPPVTPPAPNCAVVGLLAPHAGHTYSGAVAARAFRAVQGQAYDLVVIAGPSHFHADGPLLTSGHSHYATPLGSVPVDQAALAALQAALTQDGRALTPLRHDHEHALEIELPFLQRALAPGFALLPLMLRDQGQARAQALGAALALVLAGRRALLVASSDLSHFYPQAVANQMDAVMLAAVAAGDPAALLRAQAEGRGQACGVGALAAVLWAAQALGAAQMTVVAHATSGDVTGDYAEVVGYGAAVFWKC